MIAHYLTVNDAIAFHADQIRLYGGADGIRDEGALASAMFRPQSGYYDDRLSEAAALWESLAQNHPFVDGKKRVSMTVTFTFLIINGYQITAEDDDVWRFMLGLFEKGEFVYANLETWLRANTKPN